MAPVTSLRTTDFEVIDDHKALVGAMKYTTVDQPLQMKAALAAIPDIGHLDVALVTETVVVQRHIERIVDSAAALHSGRKLVA